MNALIQVTDADETRYNAALTCDANGNITQVVETYNSLSIPPSPESTLTTDFTYDALNRLTEHKTTRYVGGGVNKTQYTLRGHQYDATGRLAKSSYSQYYAGDMPSLSSLEHVYAGANHVQNYDGASAYGGVWHWAGSANSHGAPLRSPNPDTASQTGYNIAALGGKGTPQRRTWLDALTEGDKRELYGQGRPQAKDSSGNGANWYLATKSDPPVSGTAVESRFFFEGTVTATDMSRATDAREAGRIGIFGTSNSYGGSYGRVTNEALGRDLNPLGRGGGFALVGGMLNVGKIAPTLPAAVLGGGMQGNSVNNPCGGGGGCGGGDAPGNDIWRERPAQAAPANRAVSAATPAKAIGDMSQEEIDAINCKHCCTAWRSMMDQACAYREKWKKGMIKGFGALPIMCANCCPCGLYHVRRESGYAPCGFDASHSGNPSQGGCQAAVGAALSAFSNMLSTSVEKCMKDAGMTDADVACLRRGLASHSFAARIHCCSPEDFNDPHEGDPHPEWFLCSQCYNKERKLYGREYEGGILLCWNNILNPDLQAEMGFDSANQFLLYVILHEMIHAGGCHDHSEGNAGSGGRFIGDQVLAKCLCAARRADSPSPAFPGGHSDGPIL